ncbi:MAG: type II toxin-antitoxin system RelE/ParE family toxin [Candidatus Nitronauta litoralis]|uniref:Type II toxin-antitoxin system RelE/ParE family toxin n=1 Tax=Candidatus Nitronauta litoralis TaxID=2705533 RepID=A0A7T0G1N4_9BACT|nr:MAG: type II toxin-antitoxin system RelE/ParE family toxin [Candidatus Nitronauta litoralis]
MEVREYLREDESSPFADWFEGLNTQAALKVNTYLTRIGNGNLSSVKSVGRGVHECVIDWGPGYRVYLGKDGDKLVILLGGGTKKRQQNDIDRAKELWQEYKKRKKEQK